MKPICLSLALCVFASCSNSPNLAAPVSLSDAVLTLPSEAVAGMSKQGRNEYLKSKSGDYDETARKLHLYNDNPYDGGDADSMLFMRVFEDEMGRSIAATHSARPFAVGSRPSSLNTFVFRLEKEAWKDISDEVLPESVSREWWFRFDDEGDQIPCGPYRDVSIKGRERGSFRFGESSGVMIWEKGRFQFREKSP